MSNGYIRVQDLDALLMRYGWLTEPERLPPCTGRRYWRHRAGGPLVCERCHPPPSAEVVAERIELSPAWAAWIARNTS